MEPQSLSESHRFHKRTFWINPLPTANHLTNLAQRRIQLTKVLDSYGFNWQVWAVAASGFFTDSYNLFATNVILPALAYVYWPNDTQFDHETVINVVSLAGSIIGQIVFGVLADLCGRQKLYGVELIIVIVATLGVAQSSLGIVWPDSSHTSMSIFGWLLGWRLVMGCGIGAEYPLSSIITSEWASVRSRGRMLASVFIMQPIGQLAAYVIAVVTLVGLNHQYGISDETDVAPVAPVIDKFWRWVTGLGSIPAAIALVFRLTIPESGRFTLDVQDDGDRAVIETRAHFRSHSASLDEDFELEQMSNHNLSFDDAISPKQFSIEDLRQYFLVEGNWRLLAATASCWFSLDFAYYGLQINNPRFLARLWASSKPVSTSVSLPVWMSEPSDLNASGNPSVSIYSVLMNNAKRAIITVSIGSVIGSLLLIKVINYLPRRRLLYWSFLGLAVLVAATGISFLQTFRSSTYGVTLALYILCQLFFNLGPNSLTFIIPAEIFPTRYRCTFHGLSAAAGKLASVIVQVSLPYMKFGGVPIRDINSNGLGWVLIIFGCVLALGALPAWAWLPDIQKPRRDETGLILPSKTLEELAGGVRQAGANGEVIGFRKRLSRFYSKRRNR